MRIKFSMANGQLPIVLSANISAKMIAYGGANQGCQISPLLEILWPGAAANSKKKVCKA
jgi:hypothetical protein